MESPYRAPRKTGKTPSWSRSRRGIVNHGGNLETAIPHDLDYWARKIQAEDMKNVKTFLQQGSLTTDGKKQFDT